MLPGARKSPVKAAMSFEPNLLAISATCCFVLASITLLQHLVELVAPDLRFEASEDIERPEVGSC